MNRKPISILKSLPGNIIPFIKRAIRASKDEVYLVASPWSPPAWMKVFICNIIQRNAMQITKHWMKVFYLIIYFNAMQLQLQLQSNVV